MLLNFICVVFENTIYYKSIGARKDGDAKYLKKRI